MAPFPKTLNSLDRALIADCFAELGQRIAAAPDGLWTTFGTAQWALAGIVENWNMQDYRDGDGATNDDIVCGGCDSPIFDHARGCPVLALQELVARL